MDLESEEMSKTVREEDGSNSVLDQLFHREIFDDAYLDEMFQDDLLGKEVHLVPFDSGFKLSFDSFLSLKYSSIDSSLFLVELT